MLRKVAETCREHVRTSDIVARLGGDEFVILLDNCPETHAHRIGLKVLKAINTLEVEWQGARYTIGASIGLAMGAQQWSNEPEWLQAADAACYRAKRQGRGQLRWHHVNEDNIVPLIQTRL